MSCKGKLGDTTLSHTERNDSGKGIILFPGVKGANTSTISKDVLDRLVVKGERLIYTIDLEYTDWEEARRFKYPQVFEVLVRQKEPLALDVTVIPPS